MRALIFRFGLVICLLALAGCKQVLFSDLDEVEANEMVAILSAAGITASRDSDKDKRYAILVEESAVATATTILRNEGYPSRKYQNLGEVFASDGVVGTPFEQHARYIHALNQELSQMLTSIKGITSAQVIVSAPAKERYAKQAPPASASVLINYEDGFDAADNLSRVKTLISHSIPNLQYDQVAVAMFAANGPRIVVNDTPSGDAAEFTQMDLTFGLFASTPGSATVFRVIGISAIVLIIILSILFLKPVPSARRADGEDRQ